MCSSDLVKTTDCTTESNLKEKHEYADTGYDGADVAKINESETHLKNPKATIVID